MTTPPGLSRSLKRATTTSAAIIAACLLSGCLGTRAQVVEPEEPPLNTAADGLPASKDDSATPGNDQFVEQSITNLDQYLKNRAVDLDRPMTPSEERLAEDRVADTSPTPPAFAIEPAPEPGPVPEPEAELSVDERIAQLSEDLAELVQLRAVTSREQYPELLQVAMLDVLGQEGKLDELLADGAATARLTPEELEVLSAFRDLLVDAKGQPPERSAELIAQAAERLRPVRSLRITDVALCSRVLGFGRYDEINTGYTFVAGRRNPMIVYAQIDGFAHAPLDGETGAESWIVELSEELALYHVSDGQPVWTRPAQGVRDRSRTKVRDFYLIQEIELPANLSVGRFNLKLTIRDKTSGASAERLIPITIVADPAMAEGFH